MEVFVLEVKYSDQGQDDVLVDCGYAGFMPLLQEAASRQGISLDDLTGILITHHDIDHMGGLQELKAAFPGAKIYASVLEAPYISGRKKSLRLQQAEALYNALPEEQKPWAKQFQESLRAVQPVAVEVELAETEAPASWSDIQIIPTPGHTPGHISIYLPQCKTLLAADAVVVEQGELELANPAYTQDLEQAVVSVLKLQQLEVERIICYHGGGVETAVDEKLKKLIAKYTSAQPAPAPSHGSDSHSFNSPACFAHLKEFREGF